MLVARPLRQLAAAPPRLVLVLRFAGDFFLAGGLSLPSFLSFLLAVPQEPTRDDSARPASDPDRLLPAIVSAAAAAVADAPV